MQIPPKNDANVHQYFLWITIGTKKMKSSIQSLLINQHKHENCKIRMH